MFGWFKKKEIPENMYDIQGKLVHISEIVEVSELETLPNQFIPLCGGGVFVTMYQFYVRLEGSETLHGCDRYRHSMEADIERTRLINKIKALNIEHKN